MQAYAIRPRKAIEAIINISCIVSAVEYYVMTKTKELINRIATD